MSTRCSCRLMATLDKDTCVTCGGNMDGTHFPADKAMEGENHPSFHINCRCTTAPYIEDLNDLSGTRIARDPVTGKNETTEAGTNCMIAFETDQFSFPVVVTHSICQWIKSRTSV